MFNKKQTNLIWGYITIILSFLYLLPLISLIINWLPYIKFVNPIQLTLATFFGYFFVLSPLVCRVITGIFIMKQVSYIKKMVFMLFASELPATFFLTMISINRDWLVIIPAKLFVLIFLNSLIVYYILVYYFYLRNNKEN